MKKHPSIRMRVAVALAGLAAGAAAFNASAFEFNVGDITTVKLDSLFTVGALMRMENRDPSLIGKSNLTPGICVGRDGDDGLSGANPDRDQNQYHGSTCNPGQPSPVSGFANANDYFVAAPGSFNPNGDNGDLNFEKGDIVNAAAKITSDLSFEIADFNFFVRGLALYDDNYSGFEQTHPDTTFQPRYTPLSEAAEDRLGMDFRLLDYFVSRTFEFADRQFNIKVGNQVLNWGESSFLLANSLNSINPPDQARLRVPGFDIKELSQPQGMVVFNAELFQGVNLETFYQYEWKPVIADPVGSFFSQSDILGEGGSYAMLSFAKAPEDPLGLYAPKYNPDSPAPVIGTVGDPAFILDSSSSRTIQVDRAASEAHKAKDSGQYGAALKFFLDSLNGGTEIGLYYANYHSRVPSISGYAANATCLPDSVSAGVGLVQAITACGVDASQAPAVAANLVQQLITGLPSLNAQVALPDEALPLDTARLFVEYPEDIHMYGISFNTTVGDWALAGEYVFRDNLPIQIHSTDLVFALLQPAFPANDLDLSIATLPGRRSAVPDFLQTTYRGVETHPGDYVAGYERQKIGQANLSLLKTFGGDNWFKASQITLLMEAGYTHLPGMPGLDELQFQGAGTDTHISAGADGSIGINPIDIRSNPNDPSSDSRTDKETLQNPTSWAGQDIKGFGTKQSYGYRIVTLTRYDDSLLGANIELLNAFFHDIKGVSPGLGQNFVEGRMQYIAGVRFDYLSTFQGELRYTFFFGGDHRDALRDRDNLLLSLGYQF